MVDSAYWNTVRLLNRVAARQVWRRASDGTSWTVSDVDGASEIDVTALVDILGGEGLGLVQVDTEDLPILRGPWRGCRWLKLTRAGVATIAAANRRAEREGRL